MRRSVNKKDVRFDDNFSRKGRIGVRWDGECGDVVAMAHVGSEQARTQTQYNAFGGGGDGDGMECKEIQSQRSKFKRGNRIERGEEVIGYCTKKCM